MILPAPKGPTAELSAELIRQGRLLHNLRAHLAHWMPGTVDWAAFSLLASLIRLGPQRQGELAGCAMLDPSTVSRHVGQLVRAGYVERRPDPLDGRAVQLVPTPEGNRMFQRIGERRDAALRAILAGWDEQDLATLATLLRRLNDDFENYRPPAIGDQPDQSLSTTTTAAATSSTTAATAAAISAGAATSVPAGKES